MQLWKAAGLAPWIIFCIAAGAIGSITSGPDEWYAQINKPSWNPPNWVFGPVWTTLYIMMGISVWRVSIREKLVSMPIGLFIFQLILNAIWTPIFFGLHQIGWALVDIVALWFAIIATMAVFYRIDRWAAALLAPYLAWVTFATYLNWTLWRLN